MESLRLWVGDQIAKFMPKPEDQIKESAAMLEQGLKDADKAYGRHFSFQHAFFFLSIPELIVFLIKYQSNHF